MPLVVEGDKVFYLLKKIYYYYKKLKSDKHLQELIDKGLQVGNNVIIQQGCFLDPSHCFLISIGDYTTLAPNVRLIAHDASMKRLFGYTRIGRITIGCNCFIGDSTIILPGVSIGDGTIIGAGSVVVKNIPANCVAVGNPCKKNVSATTFFDKTRDQISKRKTPFAESRHNHLTRQEQQEVLSFLENETGYVR